MGLEFDHPQGAKLVMRQLYEHGVWAIFSTLDPRVLQFKPGILLGPELVDEVLDRTERRRSGCVRAEARDPVATAGGDRRAAREAAMSEPRPAETPRRAARADDAAAGALGGERVRRLRPRPRCRIVDAVADAAYQNAERYAEWAVRETGMGVVEHKRSKNEVCSRGIVERYAATTTSRRGSTRSAASSRCRGPQGWCWRSRPRPTRSRASTSRCCCR